MKRFLIGLLASGVVMVGLAGVPATAEASPPHAALHKAVAEGLRPAQSWWRRGWYGAGYTGYGAYRPYGSYYRWGGYAPYSAYYAAPAYSYSYSAPVYSYAVPYTSAYYGYSAPYSYSYVRPYAYSGYTYSAPIVASYWRGY